MIHFERIEALGREMLVYLPPSYHRQPDRRFPVAYVQDGGELFEMVSNQLDHLAAQGKLEEILFVGVKPHNRNEEYTPWPAPPLLEGFPPFGGKGRQYVDELAGRLKPYIDERYRTKPEAEHTAIIGGSFGGLISLFAGYWRADVFGRLGLLSASFWFEGVLPFIQEQPALPDSLRIYMSVGDCEGIYKTSIQMHMVPYTIEASKQLVEKGFPAGQLCFELREGGTHDSFYMSEHLLRSLAWLYPSQAEQETPSQLEAPLVPMPQEGAEYSIPGTRRFAIRSRKTGREYRIMVWQPKTAPPEEGYSVLYSLDGNATFGTLAEAMRLQGRKPHGMEPQVIVAIGYDSDEPIVSGPRFYDYTIAASQSELPARPDGSAWPEVGGAEAFSDFIEDELKPAIEGLVRINRKRQALFGHSLGGFFALHTLFSRPESYQSYIAGSPSIWWKGHDLLKRWPKVEDKLRRGEIAASLLIGIGSDEKPSMVADAERLYEGMLPYAGEQFKVQYRRFDGEGHISVLPPLVSELLRFIR
ncbi:alpha/beta hydrolase [Paenibacillus pinisoli]|uniref:Alpha/beta hydrolase n=1 Tax=Paenibacillus pinisoli TaxID=1276110 RepID=A0A3A6Q172_9BACL|nr:alpha/beta hydrolase-fold protein [Paenibacillus pinisoli]RJX39734.1 alpha/beta hydrolase [Paenibacillus pinisoli]